MDEISHQSEKDSSITPSRSWPRSQGYHLIQNKIQLENANHILVYIKINVVNMSREVIFHLYSTLRPHLLRSVLRPST